MPLTSQCHFGVDSRFARASARSCWIIASRYAVIHSILFHKIVVHFASRFFVLGSGLALTRRTTQNHPENYSALPLLLFALNCWRNLVAHYEAWDVTSYAHCVRFTLPKILKKKRLGQSLKINRKKGKEICLKFCLDKISAISLIILSSRLSYLFLES